MWRLFKNDEELFMIKIKKRDTFEIYLNDLKDIWFQNISESAIQEQFQQTNPLFDVKLEKISSEVLDLVQNIANNTTTNLVQINDKIELNIKTKRAGFDLHFKFNLERGSSDLVIEKFQHMLINDNMKFLKEMTVPLIQTVKCLEEQQKTLSNLLQKKDRELEEYKLEKGEISRTDLMTEKFEENLLQASHSDLMLNVFNNSQEFWQNFIHQYGENKPSILEVQKEPWNHIKRKQKVYSSKTSVKKGRGINYNNETSD